MIPTLALVMAYALDRVFGEPASALHPVAWMGSLIAVGRDWALSAGRVGQLLRGGVVAVAVPSLAAALSYLVLRLVGRSPLAVLVATVLLLKPMFAVRALGEAAFVVRDALDCGDVEAARRGLGSLCSRKADSLDAKSLIAATIESVAENASDSIVAPLFFFACFGLPGAAFYRSANTLDAMIGYRGHFEYAGKVAARVDDLLNFLPARLTALLLLASGVLAGADGPRGFAILLRDASRTESPNAGRPMAAMAGLLGVRLEKESHYALGDAHRELGTSQITLAWQIVSIASAFALVLAALLLGIRHG